MCIKTLLYQKGKNKTRRSTMRPQATFSFFIFFTTFSFFHSPHRSFLHVAPFSASILPPHPSFLLVPPSSSSLFFPRPELSRSFRIRKSSWYYVSSPLWCFSSWQFLPFSFSPSVMAFLPFSLSPFFPQS